MGLFAVLGIIFVISRAGSWGVPYFTFSTENGSECRNDLAGYTCPDMSLADLEFYTGTDLPDDSRVLAAAYSETHDYEISAHIEVPPASAEEATKTLNEAYGKCVKGHYSPLDLSELKSGCVRSNDMVTTSGEASGEVYVVASGLAEDGTLVARLEIKSR